MRFFRVSMRVFVVTRVVLGGCGGVVGCGFRVVFGCFQMGFFCHDAVLVSGA